MLAPSLREHAQHVTPVLEEPADEGHEGRQLGHRVALVLGELLRGPTHVGVLLGGVDE